MARLAKEFDATRFTDHVVSHYELVFSGGHQVEVLHFKKPGTVTHMLRFVRAGHQLFVSGDYGDAVYSWSSQETMEWMSNTDVQYFLGKCTASSHGVPFRDWSSEAVRQRGVESIKQDEEDEPPEDSVLPLWGEKLKVTSVNSEEELHRFLEEEVGDWYYRDKIPLVVRERYGITEYHVSVGTVNTPYGELFFGEDWWECAPDGWVDPYQGIVHHGALFLAFKWMREHPLAFEWEQALPELEGLSGP